MGGGGGGGQKYKKDGELDSLNIRPVLFIVWSFVSFDPEDSSTLVEWNGLKNRKPGMVGVSSFDPC
jgi:hypothetical protein